MNIMLESIFEFCKKLSLLYSKNLNISAKVAFYIDNIFEVHQIFEKQYCFF